MGYVAAGFAEAGTRSSMLIVRDKPMPRSVVTRCPSFPIATSADGEESATMTARYFTKDHEWVRVDGDIATIGITNHAQEQLGDVVFVELPAVGKKVDQGRRGRGR